MKFSLLLGCGAAFLISANILQAQSKKNIEHAINSVLSQELKPGWKLCKYSFLPDLNDEILKEEKTKKMVREIGQGALRDYLVKMPVTTVVYWDQFNLKNVELTDDCREEKVLQISSPVFGRAGKEVLLQLRSSDFNWVNFYRITPDGKSWKPSYNYAR